MNKARLLLILAVVALVATVVTEASSNETKSKDCNGCSEEASVVEIIDLVGERVIVEGDLASAVRIRSIPAFKTVNDYRAYASRRVSQLITLARERPDRMVRAIVSPNRPLTPWEYMQLLEKYVVTVVAFKYWSYPEGSGQIIVPAEPYDPFPKDLLSNWESRIKAHQGSDFVLVSKIVGIKVLARPEELMRIKEDPLVLLVDVGPLSVVRKYQGVVKYIEVNWQYVYEWLP